MSKDETGAGIGAAVGAKAVAKAGEWRAWWANRAADPKHRAISEREREQREVDPALRRRKRLRLLAYTAAVLVGLGLAGLAVQAPLRSLVAQNERLDNVREEIAVLDRENEELDTRVTDLGTDAMIERLAREELGLVRPGEDAIVLVPPGSLDPVPATTLPVPAPAVPETTGP